MQSNQKSITRRSLLENSARATAASLLMTSPLDLLRMASAGAVGGATRKRLSWMAYRGDGVEGDWLPTQIEGKIPKGLTGTLYRNGPGKKETYGTPLKHLFDGDALVSAFKFANGGLTARSRFIETAERAAEREAQKMLYSEFGTLPPGGSKGYKNSPVIHVMNLPGQLVALSEASHPIALNPQTLESQGVHDFQQSLPKGVSFTAHPKIDPETGDAYAFGITMSLFPAIKTFRIDSKTKIATELNHIGLGGYYPVHDMMLTKNYMIFVVSPIYVSLPGAAMGSSSISDLLNYEAHKPLRIYVCRKDRKGLATEIFSTPAGVNFHHANAFEDEVTGNIIFDTMMIEDFSVYPLLAAWSNEELPKGPKSWLTRFELDLKKRKVLRREAITEGTPIDFPCIDQRRLGQRVRYVHAIEASNPADPLALNTIACWDVEDRRLISRAAAGSGRMFGEPVFVPFDVNVLGAESDGWLLNLGYDQNRDETFIDIRRAVTLEPEARVWLGRFLPIGFHGSWV